MFDGQNNLVLNRHNDVIFYPWNQVGPDLAQESAAIEYQNGGVAIRGPQDGLGDVAGNLFVMGHGNYSPMAKGGGANGDRSLGAHKLARAFSPIADCLRDMEATSLFGRASVACRADWRRVS